MIKIKSFSETYIFFCLALTITVLFFIPAFISKYPLGGYDLVYIIYSLYAFMNNSLLHGIFPLWDPGLFSGFPLIERMFVGILYPPNVLFFLGTILGTKFFFLFHTIVCAIGMYFVCLELKITPKSAVISSLSFAFSSQFVDRMIAGQVAPFAMFALLPMIVLFSIKVCRNINALCILILSLLFGLEFYAGHPFGVLISFILILYIMISFSIDKNSYIRIFLSVLFGISIGFAAFLPVLNLGLSTSISSSISIIDRCRTNSLPFENLILFLFPASFGYSFFETIHTYFQMFMFPYYGRGELLWEFSSYFGIIAFFLSIYSVFYIKNKPVKKWIILSIVGVILSFGTYTPLYKLILLYIPGTKPFYTAGKYLIISLLSLSILAGYGLDNLIESSSDKRLFPSKLVLIFSTICILIFTLVYLISFPFQKLLLENTFKIIFKTQQISDSTLNKIIYVFQNFFIDKSFPILVIIILGSFSIFLLYRNIISKKIFYFLICLLVIIDLGLFFNDKLLFTNVSDYTIPDKIIKSIKKTNEPFRVCTFPMFFNRNITNQYSLENVNGYMTGIISKYQIFLSECSKNSYLSWFQCYSDDWEFLSKWLNCKYVISSKKINSSKLDFIKSSQNIYLYSIKSFYPRLWFYPLNKPNYTNSNLNKIYGIPAKKINFPLTSLRKKINYKYISSTSNTFKVELNVPENGLIVFSEISYPGWKAYDLGKQIDTFEWNNIFRSVYLEKGKHTISFKYLPISFVFGSAVSIFSILLLFFYYFYKKFLSTNT